MRLSVELPSDIHRDLKTKATVSAVTAQRSSLGVLRGGTLVLDRSTVSRNDDVGILLQAASTTATITDSSVVRNNGTGGIVNFGTVTLTRSKVNGNTRGACALGGICSTIFGGGGGIYNAHLFTATGSTVSGNSSNEDGGGIYNATNPNGGPGRLVVEDSKITGNSAINGQGGGIFNMAPATVALTNVKFKKNTPDDCNGC